MSGNTFTPGKKEHTYPAIFDIDGTVYSGETLKLKGSMTLYSPEPELEGSNPLKSEVYLYGVTYGQPEQENRVEALRLLIVDSMGHDSWLDGHPVQMRGIAELLIREAQKLEGDQED